MGLSAEAAHAWLEAECARWSLSDYARLVSAEGYEQPPHVALLIEYLEAVERREFTRLIVEMPPRSSKSTHVARLLPSWWLGRHPGDAVIIASYGEELASGHGRAVRDLLGHPRYPFPVDLKADSRAAGRWHTTGGGGLIAAGVGTGLTGFGGDLNVLDDPVKGREEAESELTRAHTWDWYQDVFLTRVQRGGVVVVMGTRWHEDDLIGRILASAAAGDWARLRVPYLAEAGDALGRSVNEPLPVFGTVPRVEAGEISAYGFSALYQQRPTPAAGGVIKAEWLQRRYTPVDLERLRTGPRWYVLASVDLGGKQGVGHDPSGIATWATDGISYYILDYWESQAEYADIKVRFAERYREHKARLLLVEDATWAQPLISDLRRESGINVAAVPPQGSKWVRADAVSPLFESGRVVLPERAPWLDVWVHQHLAFPNAQHDEAVDTTSLALSRLSSMPAGGTVRTVQLVDRGIPDRRTQADRMRERLQGARHGG